MRLRVLVVIGIAAVSLPNGTQLHAQAPGSGSEKLQFIAVLSRHGVRTPLATPEQLRDYAPQPWPPFDAPTGYLTPRGARLMQLLGTYYREYLTRTGLLAPAGCADLDKFYLWSDTTGRDIESAWILGHAMMPACGITIHRLGEGRSDPLFAPIATGVGKLDSGLARAAYLKSAGGSPEVLLDSYRADLEIIDQVLLGCKPGPNCPPAATEVKRLIMKQPALVLPENAAPSSPMLAAANAVVEALLSEYLDGMDQKDVGWGRLDADRLRSLRRFHDRYFEMAATPYRARAEASNLLSHILRSLEQAARGAAVPGSLGKPGGKALILLGHDSNVVDIARMLGLSWEAEKGLPGETPPGCALIFELWRDAASGKQTVRTYFQTQTFDQLRHMTPLSLKTPPARMAVSLPGCGADTGRAACEWERFRSTVDSAIDPAFVAPIAPVPAANPSAAPPVAR